MAADSLGAVCQADPSVAEGGHVGMELLRKSQSAVTAAASSLNSKQAPGGRQTGRADASPAQIILKK